jgi:aquaporin Z
MNEALREHWPEYLMEAAELGIFMFSACGFGVLLEHPDSPVRQMLADPFVRRMLMGLAMGLTAITIVYSPWGKQSGAHFNPAFTLTFFRLGKVARHDAVFYVIAQFIGGITGVLIAAALFGRLLANPAVNYVVTLPGASGVAVAFMAEVVITFILMAVVLLVSNNQRVASFTGLFAGTLVAMYITFEAPFSGMSMNPARTFGSAFPAQVWTALWIYFSAPLLGMLAAAQVYIKTKSANAVKCAKLHHQNNKRCIFCGKPAGVS